MGCGATKPVHVEPVVIRHTEQQQQQRQRNESETPYPYPPLQPSLNSTTPTVGTANANPLRQPTQQQQQEHQKQQQNSQQVHRLPPQQLLQSQSGSPPLHPSIPAPFTTSRNGSPVLVARQNGSTTPSHSSNVQYNGTTTRYGTVPTLSSSSASPPPPIIVTTTTTVPDGTHPSPPDNRPIGMDDPQWKDLFMSLKDLLLDPADVHSTLQDLMGRPTNRLSEVEVLHLQRRVRTIVRQSQVQAEQSKGANRKPRLPFNTKDGHASGGSNGGITAVGSGGGTVASPQDIQDMRTVKEKYHLLTRYVVSRVLPRQPQALLFGTGPTMMNGGLSSSPNGGSNRSLSSLGGMINNNSNNNNHGNNGSTDNNQGTVHIVDTVYLLASYCNDSLWDGVAEIAIQSAQAAGMEMDVNKKKKKAGMVEADQPDGNRSNGNDDDDDNNTAKIPEPVSPTVERTPEAPQGVGLQALAFILGLALRGTRAQRLHLLFYVMLPPKTLQVFLENHPAGGVPTWLLEVGQNTIISLASLSHYYWFGGGSTDSPFLPTTGKTSVGRSEDGTELHPAWNKEQQRLALTIPGREVIKIMLSILMPNPKDDPSSPTGGSGSPNSGGGGHNNLTNSLHNNNPAITTPTRKSSTIAFKRRGSSNADPMEDAETPQTEVMERLRQQQNISGSIPDSSFVVDDYCDEAARCKFVQKASAWLKLHPVASSICQMTIFDFDTFAESALDDGCLSAVMQRLFGHGWILNPSSELDMVKSKWREWQEHSDSFALWSRSLSHPAEGRLEIISQNVRKVMENGNGNAAAMDGSNRFALRRQRPFGGLGGFDGRGGIGFGVMYCIDKNWWDSWESYVGWSWAGDTTMTSTSPAERIRPKELSNENLLNREDDYIVAGAYGSYEVMKKGLEKDVHYVLVPPGVWDILYEVYGGGPPLPRMVSSPGLKDSNGGSEATELDIEVRSIQGGNVLSTGRDRSVPTELDLDAMASTDYADRVLRIPRLMDVESHPWVVHVHLCDPHQPYRKGHNDAGPMTIRVMASPDQPLWRLYAEIVVRLPFHLYQSYGPDGRGKARLWKRLEADAPKDPSWRYGPWPCALLCKNRFALLPRQSSDQELEEHYDELRENWEAYADHATVESIGLLDGSQLIVEFAVVHKNGEIIWPREAAAKAGRVRRLADTDTKFRNLLRGLDINGKALAKPPELVGMVVDAMDASGRWYDVRITQVQTVVLDTDEEDDDSDDDAPGHAYDLRKDSGEQTQVRVDFTKYGGHPEWIDVDSDRLATAGRFTLANGDDAPEAPAKPAPPAAPPSDAKNKAHSQVKKAVPENGDSTAKICPIPGYGACGLANLGNTCYINAALQCISYFPLLRAYLLSGEYKTSGDLNKDNPLGTDGKLLEEFVDLLRLMWSAKVGEKSPTRFRGLIAKLNSDFAGANQQDAQELLSYVLDGLMEDSNRVRKKPYVEGLEDDWVKETSLLRVGEEAWRRHLRRSRSIITDIATGQLMSTTTCPICNFSSRSFDPFNLLSVPLPTVADVLFKIYIVRRATALNTPWVLNKPKVNGRFKTRFQLTNDTSPPVPQSGQVIVEQHIIAMSRLADSSDLRLKIQDLCGIPASDLRICSAEEKLVASEQDEGTVVRSLTDMTLLTEKKGPCSTLARQRTASEDLGTSPSTPSLIVAFESTLRARPVDKRIEGADGVDESSEHSAEEEEDEANDGNSKKEARELQKLILKYGNSEECRLYDTDALPIAMAISRSIWPTKEEELKVGLRVDAIDHKDLWYPGSVVEILDGGTPVNGETKESDSTAKTKVRIHFDTFSSKWDEYYTIDHFKEGRVKPLYSHAAARTTATEFIVHHRYTDRRTRASCLFGQPFYVKCHSEWSIARAGAQILSQASRYLRLGPIPDGPVDVDGAQEREAKVKRLYERTHTVISDLIDVLIECDRDYVRGALGVMHGPNDRLNSVKRFRNPSFDASAISSSLVKRVQNLIHRLPFEVRVCMSDSPLGSVNEEVPLPFSVMRSIGNYMSTRHAIVLQWREPPSDKKAVVAPPNSKYSNYLGAPVMYVPPEVVMDEASAELLDKANQKAKRPPSAKGSGGLPLGICITEFCKVQQLSKDDTWRCPRCKDFRTGANQNLVLWRLPDLLTVHMKRFHCSTKWREKITTKINFPLTGLDMKEWCHPESPVIQSGSQESYVYDLIGVLNHYGGMTGGHYVATCKATPCSKDGREEVAYDFNGVGTNMRVPLEEDADVQTGWKFGRQKVEVNPNKVTAAATAKAAGESAEPLWLQFDDDVVEPIPPRHVVSETAYVLFYRRRRLTPANVARYSTLE